jgi:hypothetical protein
VFEGSAGVRTTILCMPESNRPSLKAVIVIRMLGPCHHDLLMRLKDDVIVFLLNVKGIEAVVHQIGYTVHTFAGLATPMPTKTSGGASWIIRARARGLPGMLA